MPPSHNAAAAGWTAFLTHLSPPSSRGVVLFPLPSIPTFINSGQVCPCALILEFVPKPRINLNSPELLFIAYNSVSRD